MEGGIGSWASEHGYGAWEHMGGFLHMLMRDLEPLSYEHEFPPTIPCTTRQALRGFEMQRRIGSADYGLVSRCLTRANSGKKNS